FIALVVSLILVIIAACSATFFLLRQEASEDEERANRRQRYLHATKSPSSYIYHPSSTPSKSWFGSLRNMFTGAADSIRYNAARKVNGREGWVQAGDEWDEDPQDERLRNMGSTMAYSPEIDLPFRPPGISTTESRSTVQFEPHSYHGIPNRFASSDSPPASVQHLPPVEAQDIPRSTSPESLSTPGMPSSAYVGNGNRRDSAKSNLSTQTFSSGTKFVEGL
ncbi:hypothetical protein GYMLUDRAFT_33104, partial [Collybiopsis luxurians FD-317 M1]